MQPIQWTEWPTSALVGASSLWSTNALVLVYCGPPQVQGEHRFRDHSLMCWSQQPWHLLSLPSPNSQGPHPHGSISPLGYVHGCENQPARQDVCEWSLDLPCCLFIFKIKEKSRGCCGRVPQLLGGTATVVTIVAFMTDHRNYVCKKFSECLLFIQCPPKCKNHKKKPRKPRE